MYFYCKSYLFRPLLTSTIQSTVSGKSTLNNSQNTASFFCIFLFSLLLFSMFPWYFVQKYLIIKEKVYIRCTLLIYKLTFIEICIRACLKNAFCKMYATICGRFYLNKGGVAGYVNRMKVKYTAKWGVQIAGMIFQTRSRNDSKLRRHT